MNGLTRLAGLFTRDLAVSNVIPPSFDIESIPDTGSGEVGIQKIPDFLIASLIFNLDFSSSSLFYPPTTVGGWQRTVSGYRLVAMPPKTGFKCVSEKQTNYKFSSLRSAPTAPLPKNIRQHRSSHANDERI